MLCPIYQNILIFGCNHQTCCKFPTAQIIPFLFTWGELGGNVWPAEVSRLGPVCLNCLGLISTPFSKTPGVSRQGKTFPIYLGSHTGDDELPTLPFCSHLHCQQHIIPSQVLVLPGPMAGLGLVGRASLPTRAGQQRSRPAWKKGCCASTLGCISKASLTQGNKAGYYYFNLLS